MSGGQERQQKQTRAQTAPAAQGQVMTRGMKLFSGNANPRLAREICDDLSLEPGRAEVKTFSDGEIYVEVGENVRGMDVFVIQPTCAPANTNLMELLILLDTMRRSSAHRITAVVPYYGYARQDRKVRPRTPISAKLVADLISAAGADRLLCMDLHAGQIQGFFTIPVDNLCAPSTPSRASLNTRCPAPLRASASRTSSSQFSTPDRACARASPRPSRSPSCRRTRAVSSARVPSPSA